MTRVIDMTGQRIGRLVILRQSHVFYADRAVTWLCRCDCGNEKKIRGTELRAGSTQSCGCLNLENKIRQCQARSTHGLSRTPEYESWVAMRDRCYNPDNPGYRYYGARGIVVCERWRDDPRVFVADMGPCPAGHSIERVDNNGPYSPDNCIWLPRRLQARNQRTSRMITHDGMTMCLAAWAEHFSVPYEWLRDPLRRGLSFAEAVGQLDARRARRSA